MTVAFILFITIINQVVDFVRIGNLTDSQQQELVMNNLNNDVRTLNSIIDSPLFGTYVELKVEKVNTTLRLLGIMSANQRDLRRAFIAEPKMSAIVYQEGDEISKGLKVHRIDSDKVTLLRYGKPETLYIAWDKVSKKIEQIKHKIKILESIVKQSSPHPDNEARSGPSVKNPFNK